MEFEVYSTPVKFELKKPRFTLVIYRSGGSQLCHRNTMRVMREYKFLGQALHDFNQKPTRTALNLESLLDLFDANDFSLSNQGLAAMLNETLSGVDFSPVWELVSQTWAWPNDKGRLEKSAREVIEWLIKLGSTPPHAGYNDLLIKENWLK